MAAVVNAEGVPLFVNVVVMAEAAWIMEKKLELDRDVVSGVISRLLLAENITLGNDLETRAALLLFTSSNIGFADCLIAKLNLAAGCAHHACPLSSGAIGWYVSAIKEMGHDAHDAGRSVA